MECKYNIGKVFEQERLITEDLFKHLEKCGFELCKEFIYEPNMLDVSNGVYIFADGDMKNYEALRNDVAKSLEYSKLKLHNAIYNVLDKPDSRGYVIGIEDNDDDTTSLLILSTKDYYSEQTKTKEIFNHDLYFAVCSTSKQDINALAVLLEKKLNKVTL